MGKTVLENIKEVIEEKGVNPEEASRLSGLERSYFRKIFERGGSSPRSETLRKIADGLNVSIARLYDGTDEWQESPKVKSDVRAASMPAPNRYELPTDIPVRGTAAGSHVKGAFQLSSDPVDYVRRPPALMGAKDIYALYVEGESMTPQFWPGDLIYINSHKPARLGDGVVIQCQNGEHSDIEATIGILSKRTAESVVIQKHNPRAEIAIPKATVISVHKILTTNELFGV